MPISISSEMSLNGFRPSAVAKSRTMTGGLRWMILTSPEAVTVTRGRRGTGGGTGGGGLRPGHRRRGRSAARRNGVGGGETGVAWAAAGTGGVPWEPGGGPARGEHRRRRQRRRGGDVGAADRRRRRQRGAGRLVVGAATGGRLGAGGQPHGRQGGRARRREHTCGRLALASSSFSRAMSCADRTKTPAGSRVVKLGGFGRVPAAAGAAGFAPTPAGGRGSSAFFCAISCSSASAVILSIVLETVLTG